MKVKVLNLEGKEINEITLNDKIFSVDFNPILFKEIIDYQMAQMRQATYGTKNRSELTYSTKKLRRQKGSGHARVGPRGAPQYRKGAVVFGPDGRHYKMSMPKAKRKKALAMCLTKKLIDNEIIVVDNLAINEIKTKNFINICSKLNLDKKTLFIDKEKQDNIYKSMRNVIGYDFLVVDGINVLSLSKCRKLVITTEALKSLEVRYEDS